MKELIRSLVSLVSVMIEMGYNPSEIDRVIYQRLSQETSLPHGTTWRLAAKFTKEGFELHGYFVAECGSCMAHTLHDEDVFCGDGINRYSPTRQELIMQAQKVLGGKGDYSRTFHKLHLDHCAYVLIAV